MWPMDMTSVLPTIVVSHESALYGIRHARCRYGMLPWEPLDAAEQHDALVRSHVNRSDLDISELTRLGFRSWNGNETVHALVSRPANRRHLDGVCWHVLGGHLPEGALLRVSAGIACVCPELAFVQCCEHLSFPEALALGEELCGTFSLPEDPFDTGYPKDASDRVGYSESEAVTSRRDIASFIEAINCVRGVRQAQRAVAYTLDGARSPMEAIVAAMFHCPFSVGGFGIETMLLNHRIDFPDSARIALDVPYAVCDAFIPDAHTTLEYNGAYHDATSSRVHDEQRRLGLEAAGIATTALNWMTLRNVEALEVVANTLYKRQGKRFRNRTKAHAVKHITLLNGLREAYGLEPC